MKDSELSVFPLACRDAHPADFQRLNRFDNRIRAGAAPPLRAISLAETVARYSRLPEGMEMAVACSADGEIVGGILLGFPPSREECPQLLCQLFVLPEHRQQRIGHRLLAYAAALARRLGATLLQFHSRSAVPAGEAFAIRIGAHKEAVYLLCELGLAGIDRYLLREWEEEVQTPDISLIFYENPRPPSAPGLVLPCSSALVEASGITPFCEIESCFAPALTDQHRRAALYDEDGGTFVGYAELRWQAAQPDRVFLTCPRLLPGYRNRELERWLLAALIGWLRDYAPQAHFLFTCQPTVDRTLAALYRDMGFRQEGEVSIWQVERRAVDGYLAARGLHLP